MAMEAVCNSDNLFLNTVLTVGGGVAALGVAAAVGAPVLVGGALGAATGLVAGVATDFFKGLCDMDADNPIPGTVIHILSSLAMAEAFILLGATITFGTAAFIAFAGAVLALAIFMGVAACCGA